MHVLHANWWSGKLWLWAESAERWAEHAPAVREELGEEEDGESQPAETPLQTVASVAVAVTAPAVVAREHVFAAGAPTLRGLASALGTETEASEIELLIPVRHGIPIPSKRLAHAVGHTPSNGEAPRLAKLFVPAVSVPADALVQALEAALSGFDGWTPGPSTEFFAAASLLAQHLLAQERFVPGLRQDIQGELHGVWQPWVSDSRIAERVSMLLAAMPPVARAAVDELNHEPWSVLEAFLTAVIDAECRRALIHEDMEDSVREKDASIDPQVAWLKGLLGPARSVPARGSSRTEMIKNVRRWISGLEDRGISSTWRLCFQITEPEEAAMLGDLEEPGDSVTWPLSFHLQSQENPRILVDAADIWLLPSDAMTIEGKRLENPQELLLKELGRASRLYPKLESALSDSEPTSVELPTRLAYQFLREVKPILEEQGFGVLAPEWWDQPSARLGARLKLTSDSLEVILGNESPGITPATSRLGLGALVNYSWDIAIGGTTLSLAEFEKLASKRTPLVRINGRWVEIRADDVKAAIKFIQENPGGEMRVVDAIRMAYGSDPRATGIPIVGLEATGWVSMFFGDQATTETIPIIEPPPEFHGSLRPYQVRGVSWMLFLERFGFGPCLADDMGLGKTVQLLAMLAFERAHLKSKQRAEAETEATKPEGWERLSAEVVADSAAIQAAAGYVPPTLLIVPMSVVGNWLHESKRFCPDLRILVHHGVDRLQGDDFIQKVADIDAVITTYALAHRDRELLQRVQWQRVVLDEAQYIKNPTTKQSQAVREFPSNARVALTGTPVENRLSELWSILDFLNPGYLGPAGTFRKRFSVPIEKYRDQNRLRQLRDLVRPFILRRLKTDPAVAADLPEKLEMREFSHLTAEQADLYESVVNRMLAEVEAAEGIQRRGLVLSTLIKLKQICNHPAQYLKDHSPDSAEPPAFNRSGKCVRLMELLETALASGDQALIFTQFRQMGTLLASMLRHQFDKDVLFLHGGTAQGQRVEMVHKFQREGVKNPILIVSLKAGGVGLNLTAATHVFHFDRWWNPAVENQATDRAHRIGQHRTVQVHKFVVRGTLEERIDEMIEQKTALAENIIGSGESWLTELSTDQLRDILTLRRDTVGDEDE